MRTFIFYRKTTDASRNIKDLYITGVIHSETYPTTATQKGGKYYGCYCKEIKENCHISLVTNGKG